MGAGEEDVPELLAALNYALLKQLGTKVDLVDSQTWYTERIPTAGSYDAWVWTTLNEQPYGGRQRYFDGFVVTRPTLGRINQEIVSGALQQGRVVLSWLGAFVETVTAVIEQDPTDWKSGWSVTTKP